MRLEDRVNPEVVIGPLEEFDAYAQDAVNRTAYLQPYERFKALRSLTEVTGDVRLLDIADDALKFFHGLEDEHMDGLNTARAELVATVAGRVPSSELLEYAECVKDSRAEDPIVRKYRKYRQAALAEIVAVSCFGANGDEAIRGYPGDVVESPAHDLDMRETFAIVEEIKDPYLAALSYAHFVCAYGEALDAEQKAGIADEVVEGLNGLDSSHAAKNVNIVLHRLAAGIGTKPGLEAVDRLEDIDVHQKNSIINEIMVSSGYRDLTFEEICNVFENMPKDTQLARRGEEQPYYDMTDNVSVFQGEALLRGAIFRESEGELQRALHVCEGADPHFMMKAYLRIANETKQPELKNALYEHTIDALGRKAKHLEFGRFVSLKSDVMFRETLEKVFQEAPVGDRDFEKYYEVAKIIAERYKEKAPEIDPDGSLQMLLETLACGVKTPDEYNKIIELYEYCCGAEEDEQNLIDKTALATIGAAKVPKLIDVRDKYREALSRAGDDYNVDDVMLHDNVFKAHIASQPLEEALNTVATLDERVIELCERRRDWQYEQMVATALARKITSREDAKLVLDELLLRDSNDEHRIAPIFWEAACYMSMKELTQWADKVFTPHRLTLDGLILSETMQRNGQVKAEKFIRRVS